MSRNLNRAPTGAGVVYVVDDDESVRRAMARLIRSTGLDVETFPSAGAFMQRKVLDRPACLLLDGLPIIFITGFGDVPMSVRAMKGGAVDFLEKPCNDQDLLDAIQRALARSREGQAETAERQEIQRRVDSLTPREREVFALVVTGMLNKQIAGELGAAEKTIKVHRGRMMKKMRAESVAALVGMAQKVGLRP